MYLAAARMLGRAIGSVDEEGDVVEEKEREERARGLVFEDAIPGVMAGKRPRKLLYMAVRKSDLKSVSNPQ